MSDTAWRLLVAAVLVATLCHCAQPGPTKTIGNGGVGVGVGSGAGSGNGSSGGCSVAWQGAVRSFGATLTLSSDSASTLVQTLFLPDGLTEAVLLEPGTPDLMLVKVDSSEARQRIDSAALPVSSAGPITVTVATDGSDAVVDYGVAESFVSSDGQVHGPFDLATTGLLSVSAVVVLEQGAGAVLLGVDSTGPIWTTLGPNGFGALNPIALGFVSDAAQPMMVLWDDGRGNVSALLEVSNGTSVGLFAMRGNGSPFTFGTPLELDTEAPGQVEGVAMALGPSGELGVLLSEGSEHELAGYVVSGTGTLAGGVLGTVSASLSFPPLLRAPWANPCAAGVCDPTLRFAADGELIAAWTVGGQLSIARLPAGGSAWESSQELNEGPLLSVLAVDDAGDVAALVQATGGPGLVVGASGAALVFETLPAGITFTSGVMVAATAAGAGSLWGFESTQPGVIASETFSAAGLVAPAAVTGLSLPNGELLGSMAVAASSVPSSEGPGYWGTAVPGWMLIAAKAGAAGDLLLATDDPSSGALGPPVSVAVSGWQQTSGVETGALWVDPQGDALVVFVQANGGSSGSSCYVTGALAGGTTTTACAPLTTSPGAVFSVEVDQIPYGPSALAGSGRIAVHSDSPARMSLAE